MINADFCMGACVKRLDNIPIAFYPLGKFRSGYVIPSENDYHRVAKLCTIANLFGSALTYFIFDFLSGFWISVGIVFLVMAMLFFVHHWVKKWPRSTDVLTYGDALSQSKNNVSAVLLFCVWWISVFIMITEIKSLVVKELDVSYPLLGVSIVICSVLWWAFTRQGPAFEKKCR